MPSSARMPAAPLPLPPSARLASAPPFPAFGFSSSDPGESLSSMPPAPPAPSNAGASNASDGEPWPAAEQEDGPTMAVASPALVSRPLRDDILGPRSPIGGAKYGAPGEQGAMVDKNAETAALATGSLLGLPDLNADDPDEPEEATRARSREEPDETTRALSRDELIRHQDASVVIGADALGDEATLAVGPGQLDFLDPSIAAAMKGTLQSREEEEAYRNAQQQYRPGGPPHGASSHGGAPHFPGSPGAHAQQQRQQSWGGAAAQPAPYGNVPPSQPGMLAGFDAMGGHGYPQHGSQGQMPGAFPQSGQHPAHGYPNAGPGPQSNPGFGPGPYDQQRGMAPMQGQPPAWMGQQPAPVAAAAPTRFTPQVIMLVAVGAVCLAIFVIGIVLFVTTKF